MGWPAIMCFQIPSRGEQMVIFQVFCYTIRDYSSIGNQHLNSESKTIDS